ncbi:threonine/serine exporter ThrE family protein [Geothrix sp. PMB-07]|uniref:threonine/serine ThrE exporter family protein n=1 Tax=Geothrix sp. PMB-07 TaxID=3068640 RepID=UPI0027420764|nr:threonine/serine exporter family protein [Geothrix sp. PMB-07]WLT30853.1 threonine/serine exporter family protein [Geothrix sp. PMB-07]
MSASDLSHASAPPPTDPAPGTPPEIALCLELGRAYQSYGIPAHRFEDALTRISAKLGLEGQYFALPTAFFASLGKGDHHWTFIQRSPPGETNLEKLADLQETSDALIEGRLSTADARQRVRDIVAAPDRWGPLVTVLCFGLGSAPSATFFGGGWREMLLTCLMGAMVGLTAVLLGRKAGLARLVYPVAGTLVGFLALAAAYRFPHVSPQVLTLAGLIVLLPGLRLVVSMNELATGNLVAGTARLVDTAMTFLSLGFGVALGQRLASSLLDRALLGAPVVLPAWTILPTLLLAAVAFVVIFKARPSDLPWIFAACLLGFYGTRHGAAWLGPQFGVGLGAFALGLGSNLYTRIQHRPSVVTLLPGLMVLVPGGLGFKGLEFIIQKQLVVGLDTAFQAVFVAIALLTGLLLAQVAVQPRTAL